jgi:protein-L-isoaspartate(D-aspartate) O-methyltransferase
VPIGYGQTISQPYIVALMTELVRVKPGDRVLEVGTGSGYQAAVLSRLAGTVHTIEILEPLAERARTVLAELGCRNVIVRTGDGYLGWPEAAPFDAIVVTAAPDHVPPALLLQLKPGGRLVIPVGGVQDIQELRLIEKDAAGNLHARDVTEVRFVPLVRKK